MSAKPNPDQWKSLGGSFVEVHKVVESLTDERDELRDIVVAFVKWMKMQRKEAPIKKAEAYLTKYPQP